MNEWIALTEYNWPFIAAGLFALFEFFKWLYSAGEWIMSKFKIETKNMRKKREEHELLVETSKGLLELQKKHDKDNDECLKHDELIREDLKKLTDTVLNVKNEVVLMRTQRDEDKLAEYKDKIGESYRFYNARKYSDEEPVPYWNHMEKEALKGLITQYESHGGSNSFVHSKVEPEMQTWKVVD